LLQHLEEDEANQQKLQKIIEARSLLASRAFDECISILLVLEKDHPSDEEIERLLAAARRERVEEQKKQALAKARMLMASRQYKECTALLEDLRKQFPADVEIPRLLGTVVEEKGTAQLEALAKRENFWRLTGTRNASRCLRVCRRNFLAKQTSKTCSRRCMRMKRSSARFKRW